MKNINTDLEEKYGKATLLLFDAVYRKDIPKVEKILLTIIEDILHRYPQKPQNENPVFSKDYETLSKIYAEFDEPYFEWLRGNGLPSAEEPSNLEMSEFLTATLSETDRQLFDFIPAILNYLQADNSFYFDQPQLLNAIEEYKKYHKITLSHVEPPFHDTSPLPHTRRN